MHCSCVVLVTPSHPQTWHMSPQGLRQVSVSKHLPAPPQIVSPKTHTWPSGHCEFDAQAVSPCGCGGARQSDSMRLRSRHRRCTQQHDWEPEQRTPKHSELPVSEPESASVEPRSVASAPSLPPGSPVPSGGLSGIAASGAAAIVTVLRQPTRKAAPRPASARIIGGRFMAPPIAGSGAFPSNNRPFATAGALRAAGAPAAWPLPTASARPSPHPGRASPRRDRAVEARAPRAARAPRRAAGGRRPRATPAARVKLLARS